MKRITLTTALAAVGTLALAATASADIGDIRFLDVQNSGGTSDTVMQGTAEIAEVEGRIRCTTSIPYGLVVKVTQPSNTGTLEVDGDAASTNDSNVEGVGAFGPNQGNEANSPCSTSLQSFEVVVQRNRDSGSFQDDADTGVVAIAGTSAENGDRGPGPFVGDVEYSETNTTFQRTDP